MSPQPDQKHPREKSDREEVNRILQEGRSDYNLAEVARLQIRYQHFPGAREIQADLAKILNNWGLTEDELYEITRKLHSQQAVYKPRTNEKEQQDWS
ncbi:DUF3288 family protein [Oscillatoria salina]|uniref:DUF3288 family protein n=1 Tax=Oscillatoria salina TaxID=331517 RepID=UPI0013BE22E2|nr:DUF3288 family protein [Oscillatoria salina]MBZ8179225.1 DUF3288 family protein [Oscillatoria salina IIICB1]NET89657.1 DUF3288 family protein [Kamptonema sp. SIO1D9]